MTFGGFSRGQGQQPLAEINMIPLIDVMLVLLVIFIVTAPLLSHAVKVDLPRAASRLNTSQPENVHLSIDAAGTVYWNGEPVDRPAWRQRMVEAAQAVEPPELHIRADGELAYRHVARVMSDAALAKEIQLPSIDVVGEGGEAIARQPGSVAIIDQARLVLTQPLSTQDALKSVPGVTVREEEGYGFIPNIGMRGLNPNRSQKLLVLEDGVPVAPGLFLANESYYSPRIERMRSIEVLKGAAGLRYGPTTIGGVINYQTKNPQEGAKVTAKAGSHGYRLLGLDAGAAAASGEAIGGISLVKTRGDGFRDNGFDMIDAVLKGGMALGANQWIGAKFTHYDNEVNTSYVGLRPYEFRDDPTKNPAPDDYFLTDRHSFDVNHEWRISDALRLDTLV